MAASTSLKKSHSVSYGERRRTRGAGGRTNGNTEEELDLEGSSRVLVKQTELDGILDNHDSLVREVFHMERFVSLLTYDPEAAKQDDSNVFQEFKAARYDIVEKFHPSSASSRPRKTRRAHTEHLQHLKGGSASNSTSISAKTRGRASGSLPENTDIWEILASAKGKGKEKERSISDAPIRRKGSVRVNEDELPSIYVSRGDKGRSASVYADKRVSPMEPLRDSKRHESASASFASRLKRPSESISMNGHSSSRKRRKTDASADDGLPFSNSAIPSPKGKKDPSRRRSSARDLRPPVEKKTRMQPNRNASRLAATSDPHTVAHDVAEPFLKTNIKRIRLLVRPPPPSFSNPSHRPLPRKHGSLSASLDSYMTLNGNDTTPEMMEETARKDAVILERISALRRQGRLLLGTDLLSSSPTPTRSPDQWDAVLESVVAYRSRRANGGKIIAKQIAQKIQAYWDGFAQREDKAKMQEEKRLRVLAKTTIRAVIDQWKRALMYVRNEEKQVLEAEERRKGHEHLDAILDQSGQILETQQVDLTKGDASRSRSRSSSFSVTMQNWESDDGGNSEEEEVVDEEEDEEEEGERREGEDDGGNGEEDEAGGEGEPLEGDEEGDSIGGEESESDIEIDALLGEHGAVELHRGTPSTPGSMTSSVEVLDSEATPNIQVVQDSEDIDLAAAEELVMASSSPSPPSSPLARITKQSANGVLIDSTTRGEHNKSHGQPAAEVALPPEHEQEEEIESSGKTSVGDESHLDISAHLNGNGPPDPPSPHIRDPTDAKSAHSAESHEQSPHVAIDSDPPTALPIHEPVAHGPSAQRQEEGEDEEHNRLTTAQPDSHTASDEAADVDCVTGASATPNNKGLDDTVTEVEELEADESHLIPSYLQPFAVAPVEWDPEKKVTPPLLLRGILRPYQQSGLEWLASLHTNNLNGILADEMGLGKTIQTIALLAHLACDRGIWGPHLIVVPTSVLLNWEMEFKKFLPGFRILSYHGNTKRRKEIRQGWNDKQRFNVCITSYTLASRDAHIFKRKAWYYMILDEAHMIKNFKSQRWNILLMFRSFRRLLLTGTPLQNNLTELWALLQFLMSGTNFANLKEFGDWFSNPLEKAIEMGNVLDDETLQRVSKLHTVLRPYLLRRLKRDVEKELPSKYDHLVLCPLSKRQRFLYDEFMSRAQTRDALQSGIYQKIANILMQLRKVCNHPDLFEVRPIVTSFAMERGAIADFEIQELLVRRRFVAEERECLNFDVLGLRFIDQQDTSIVTCLETRRLDATSLLPSEVLGESCPRDTRSIVGFRAYRTYQQRAETLSRWSHIGYLNRLRCHMSPIYSRETIGIAKRCYRPLLPLSAVDKSTPFRQTAELINAAVKSYPMREHEMGTIIDKFTFVTPAVVARDLPRIALAGTEERIIDTLQDISFDHVLHRAAVKLQIAFPDPSLLQYDCGKLQELTRLLREKKAGGHRVLIFTQMTKILDILEIFLNFHGYLYLRLDGATKIEDRQYITERFNADARVFCFIASSRSGGVGINLTGADTVVFYDSDFNPQMDRQCEDRAHRIGQIRDVHIYRFISQHTVEEAMLKKANQKRSLDDLVIQKGEFDWRSLFGDDSALTNALGEFEDMEDAHAAAVAAREEVVNQREDEADFGGDADVDVGDANSPAVQAEAPHGDVVATGAAEDEEGTGDEVPDEGGTIAEYMVSFIGREPEFFKEWRL